MHTQKIVLNLITYIWTIDGGAGQWVRGQLGWRKSWLQGSEGLALRKQVDVVLLLKTRRHAVLLRLITHACILHTVYYNIVFKFAEFWILYLINSWIIWNSRNMLISAVKNAYLNNHSKTTHYAQKYLLNCFIVCLLYYSFEILLTEPQGCSSFLFA